MTEPTFFHQHPFRMWDVVLEREEHVATVVKAVTTGEVVRCDPHASCGSWPFSLLLETMAQAAVPLAAGPDDHPAAEPSSAWTRGGRLVGIDGARLVRPVVPGDRLLITASRQQTLGDLIRVSTIAEIAGSEPGSGIVAEAEFTLALGGPAAP